MKKLYSAILLITVALFISCDEQKARDKAAAEQKARDKAAALADKASKAPKPIIIESSFEKKAVFLKWNVKKLKEEKVAAYGISYGIVDGKTINKRKAVPKFMAEGLIIRKLKEGTQYWFKVQAIYEEFPGPWSEKAEGTTGAITKPAVSKRSERWGTPITVTKVKDHSYELKQDIKVTDHRYESDHRYELQAISGVAFDESTGQITATYPAADIIIVAKRRGYAGSVRSDPIEFTR